MKNRNRNISLSTVQQVKSLGNNLLNNVSAGTVKNSPVYLVAGLLSKGLRFLGLKTVVLITTANQLKSWPMNFVRSATWLIDEVLMKFERKGNLYE